MKVKKNFKIEEKKLVGFMVIITQHVAQLKGRNHLIPQKQLWTKDAEHHKNSHTSPPSSKQIQSLIRAPGYSLQVKQQHYALDTDT